MGFHLGKGWDKTSEDLFIHDSGVRISKTSYRGTLGWWIFPVDLDAPPVEHAPTDAGREEAFTAVAKGLPKPKVKKDPRQKKVAAPEDEEVESKGGPPDADGGPEREEPDEEEKDD